MAANQQQQMQMLADLEVEMTTDMLKRMTSACQRKCVPTHYSDGELSKGEGICLDRCVAKYLEINESMGKKLSEMFKQDEDTMKQIQEQQAAAQVQR